MVFCKDGCRQWQQQQTHSQKICRVISLMDGNGLLKREGDAEWDGSVSWTQWFQDMGFPLQRVKIGNIFCCLFHARNCCFDSFPVSLTFWIIRFSSLWCFSNGGSGSRMSQTFCQIDQIVHFPTFISICVSHKAMSNIWYGSNYGTLKFLCYQKSLSSISFLW